MAGPRITERRRERTGHRGQKEATAVHYSIT
jgi:hypothetical protein